MKTIRKLAVACRHCNRGTLTMLSCERCGRMLPRLSHVDVVFCLLAVVLGTFTMFLMVPR